MADLTDAQAAGNTKLIGSDSTGAETNFAAVNTDGSLVVKEKKATANVITSIAASNTNVTLLAANSNRIGATVYNDSNATLYLKLGATASTASYTVQMGSKTYYETPYGYTGQIDGIWLVANGNARMGELT